MGRHRRGVLAAAESGQFSPFYEDGRQPRSEKAAERGVTPSISEKWVPFAVPDDIQPYNVNSSTGHITREISEGFPSSTTRLPSTSVPFIPTAATITTSPDSPTLGPDGITQARERRSNQPSDHSITSSQLSDYDNILPEKGQLERSITALEAMFSQWRSGEGRMDESPDTVHISGTNRL